MILKLLLEIEYMKLSPIICTIWFIIWHTLIAITIQKFEFIRFSRAKKHCETIQIQIFMVYHLHFSSTVLFSYLLVSLLLFNLGSSMGTGTEFPAKFPITIKM